MSNTNYIIKVIMSCQTIEQVQSCEGWIKRCRYNSDDYIHSMQINLILLNTINSMFKYLKRKGEVNES